MYNFMQLSPADFEELTRDLLQADWNTRLESFKTGKDKGIDLRYTTTAGGEVIVQCKHFVSSNVGKLIRHLKNDEYPKIKKLNPDRYVIVTSLGLTPMAKDKIMAALYPFVKGSHDILGAEDINNLLTIHDKIETQHFKLWMSSTAVLHKVLHNASCVQTDFDVARVRRSIPLYVQTPNYTRALNILKEHKFVIISGVPGIGKTTLADMLLFAHLEAGFTPVVIKSEISEGKDVFNDQIKQVFYFDDFLGETFLGNRFDFLAKKEDSAILNFMDIIRRSKNSRLILTTREHILRHAYQISEHFKRERGGLDPHRCILELHQYSLLDRGRILYNHIYFSMLPDEYKIELLRNGFYMDVLKHRNFNPRLVEWLSRYVDPKSIPATGYREEILRVLENPEQLWRIAYEQQISDASRSVLLALYSLGGKAHIDWLAKSWRILHSNRAKKYNWKMTPEDLRRSLQDLEGGFLKFENTNASFVNPSVKDFLDGVLGNDMENLDDVLVAATSFEQIVNIWSLAQSPKGESLQSRFKESPELLVEAMRLNLQNPHEQQLAVGAGVVTTQTVDVRPEVRLRTMLSVAGVTRSTRLLDSAREYTVTIIQIWSKLVPDFRAVIDVLVWLDKPGKWQREIKNQIYHELKRAIIRELVSKADSTDLDEVIGYLRDEDERWTSADRNTLGFCVQNYFENRFDEEFGDLGAEDEFEELLSRVTRISAWSGYNAEQYVDQILEAIADMERSEEDSGSVREWAGEGQFMPEYLQEAEVRRVFDGFLFSRQF